ncbi:MAG: TolC family protein [Haliscomenobacter sp.]|nr:TolC family protein [Haliscomenobacter sp.]
MLNLQLQNKSPVDDAINMALKNNLEIQSQQLNVQSSVSLKNSVFELPKTNVNFQFGQYNSINQDKAFQINQSIPFPTYYSAKSNLYKAELQGSQFQQQATASEIKAQVQYWFYQLLYLQNAKKAVTVFRQFL